MSTSTEICNLALSHLGSGVEIANVESPTERSAEARACRRFYEIARQQTLRDYGWPFATKFAALALVGENPTSEWRYSYRYPADCLQHRKILSGLRQDTRYTRVPMRIGQDGTGQLIYTDKQNAESEYTADVKNNALFPPDFVMAFSYRLANYIAKRVLGGDPYGLGDKALQMYVVEISKSEATGKNEEQVGPDPQSEFITAREGELPSWQNRLNCEV